MSKNDMITIGQILEMTPGDRQNATWINDEFEAVVSDVKMGSGKAPNTAVLTDPHNSGIAILGNFFGVDPSRYAGKVCHFSGKGITRTEYKGTQQVTFGDKATIQVVGTASPGQTKAPAGSPAAAAHAAVDGQTIGMAMKEACANLRDLMTGQQGAEAYFTSPQYSKDLWTQASDILRVSRLLSAGKLAPSAKDRADPDAAQREEEERRAKEEAERKAKEEEERKAAQAANQTPDTGEEVPF